MKIKQLFKGLLKKSTQTGKLTNSAFWTSALWNDELINTLPQQIIKGYATNPYLYAVLSRISQTVARLNYSVVNNGNEVVKGDIYNLFKQPNETQMWQTFIEQLTLNLLTGETFILNETVVGYENNLLSMKILNNRHVEVILDGNQNVGYYRYYERGRYIDYPPERIYHISLANIVYNDGEKAYRGLSPLEPLVNTFTASNNIIEAESAIFKNRGITGILTNDSDVPLLPKDQEKLQEEWQNSTAGASRFGMVKIINSKLRYLELSMSPKELQLTGTNIDKLRTICNVYNIDSSLFNDPANKTYNNREEAQKAFYFDCVIPWAELILSYLNNWFKKAWQNDDEIIINYDKIDALKEINKTLSDKIVQEVNAGIITPEQALSILYPQLNFQQNGK